MSRNILKMIGISIFLIILSCCNIKKNNSDSNANANANALNKVLAKQILSIKNKELKSLSKILGDSIITSNSVIFLYNGFDCETCIDAGYEIAKEIDSIAKNQIVYIISISANTGRDQLNNEYQHYVYNDEHDLIRKDLKYIYTPVFLKLNANNKIVNVYYPDYKRIRRAEADFIRSCLTNQS